MEVRIRHHYFLNMTFFNASVAFSFQEDKYRLTLIGKNLADESYVTTFSGDNFRYQIPRDAERYFWCLL